MAQQTVTVFGATGFLGRRIVERLLEAGMVVRVSARHPERLRLDAPERRVDLVPVDVRDAALVATAVEGAQAVINAVGLYVESGQYSFENVHISGAASVAEQAARAGVAKLVHLSGIGADPASRSRYVRARAQGERAVKERFPNVSILRPSVLFGPGDAFLSTIDTITRVSPVFPLFGRGDTRLQPIYVGDVADAALRCIERNTANGRICELGGPGVYTYRQVVEQVLRFRRRRRVLLPVPFAVWSAQAKALNLLPSPPLSEDQIILMRADNVVAKGVVTLEDLGVVGHDLEAMLPRCLASPNP